MSSPVPRAGLLGREAELEAIGALVHGACRGAGGALVVRGETGMGKSALLDAAHRLAAEAGMRALATTGAQSEAQMPFAGLHQLLRPLLDDLNVLVPRHREHLQAAFGLSTVAEDPGVFAIAIAALELLSESAARAPLLLTADDVQWLDRPSADVLAFVARRVAPEPIVLLLGIGVVEQGGISASGLPSILLAPLDDAASATLLAAESAGLDRALRERVLREAAGNPLALVELPAALRDATSLPASAPLPLTARLEDAFASRLATLPAGTRTMLLLAAADPGCDLALLIDAANGMGADVSLDDLQRAIDDGLADLDRQRLRFRHPLVASAVYQAATTADRVAAHTALAGTLVDEPDRATWHRASAATGPDPAVADKLEALAGRAVLRGGAAVSVAALERAATLVVDPRRRAGLLLRAAELACDLGRRQTALRLLAEADLSDAGPLESGRRLVVGERLSLGPLSPPGRLRELLAGAVAAHEAGDRELGCLLTWLTASHAWWSGASPAERESVMVVAERFRVDLAGERCLVTVAQVDPIGSGEGVLGRRRDAAPSSGRGHLGAMTTPGAGDPHRAAALCGAAVERARVEGRLGLLPQLLVAHAINVYFAGDWETATSASDEAIALGTETGQRLWVLTAGALRAMLDARLGKSESAERLARGVQSDPAVRGMRFLLALAEHARGVAALGAGRYDEALEHLQRLFDPGDPCSHYGVQHWAIADFAEAASRGGHPELARPAVENLDRWASQMPSPLLHVGLNYAHAVLAAEGEADSAFETATATDLTQWPVERARLMLAYGTWLRRRRRVVESRAPLRAARDGFDELEASGWSARAREELGASGEQSRHRTAGARDELTTQELQIANMAAAGMTNRQIGQQLFLSHRTVGSHLYHVFPKLGIARRSDLADALASTSDRR